MSCGHRVSAVQRGLAAVPGVEEVLEVSFERGEARLRGAAPLERLRAAVEPEDYRVIVPG